MYTIRSGRWRGLAKLQEEMSELNTILSKIVENGGYLEYWNDTDLGENLIEELGDVLASLTFFVSENFPDFDEEAIFDRAKMKIAKYEEWLQDVEAH